MAGLTWAVVGDFARSWRRLLAADLLYKLAALIVLWPLTGLVLKTFVLSSGSAAIADQDILLSVLSVPGILGVVVMAALLLAVAALGQAGLMAIGFGALRGTHVTPTEAVSYSLRHAVPVLRLSIRVVLIALLLTAPFLIAGGLVSWLLLSEFDINYYLSHRPPAFWMAGALLAGLLGGLGVLLVPRLVGWVLALPLVLFEDVSPARALRVSMQRAGGRRWMIGAALAVWAASTVLLSALLLAAIVALGRWILPLVLHSLTLLVPVIGGLVLLWAVGNLLVSCVQSATLALLVVRLYDRCGDSGAARLDENLVSGVRQANRPRRWSARGVLYGFAGAAVLAALAGAGLMRSVRVPDDVLVIAHRGASAVAPENTLAAVESAIAGGADLVEIDVQETADGEIFVFHDSDFMKVAGVDLKIWDATAEQLAAIDIGSHFSSEFSAQRVPRLADVLALCKDKCRVDIELKSYGHNVRLEERVAAIVEAAGMPEQVVLMSLEHPAVRKMKALRPDWTVGLLASTAVGDLTQLEADFLAIHKGMANRSFIRRAHRRGKDVYVWTVNDPIEMSRLMSLGVDGVITDHPALARTVLQQRAGMSSVERLLLKLVFLAGVAPENANIEQ